MFDYEYLSNSEKQSLSEKINPFFQRNKLDDSVLKFLFSFSYLDGVSAPNDKESRLPKTIAENIELHQKRNRNLRGIESKRSRLFENLFKGVDKKLKMPILVKSCVEQMRSCIQINETYSQTNFRGIKGIAVVYIPVSFFQTEDLVSLSPKNLMKYYSFPEKDAKAFFKNNQQVIEFQRDFEQTTTTSKHLLVKRPEKSFRGFLGLISSNLTTADNLMATWAFDVEDSENMLQYAQKTKSTEEDQQKIIQAITEAPLPCLDLNIWKSIAADRYDRLNAPEKTWANVTDISRKRLLVNTIRHASQGYHQSYNTVGKEDMEKLHEITFEIVLKKIMRQFPFLSNECQTQLTDRDTKAVKKKLSKEARVQFAMDGDLFSKWIKVFTEKSYSAYREEFEREFDSIERFYKIYIHHSQEDSIVECKTTDCIRPLNKALDTKKEKENDLEAWLNVLKTVKTIKSNIEENHLNKKAP